MDQGVGTFYKETPNSFLLVVEVWKTDQELI
jgi:hypothetical protein